MENSDLIDEVLKSLNEDVENVKLQVKTLTKLAEQPPVDYGPSIEALTKAMQDLRNQPKPTPAAVDFSPVTKRIDGLEESIRQRPEYKMSQYMQYGGYAFGLLVVLLVVITWFALDWKEERDRYQQAYTRDNWRVRYTEQANPDYYAFMEGVLRKEPAKVYQWVEEQEQADQKRALAREAAEQAKAMSAQADQLEGKKTTKRR